MVAGGVAGTQIIGGLLVPKIRRIFKLRTTVISLAGIGSVVALVMAGVVHNFWVAVSSLVVWAFMFSVAMPIRLAFLNGMIPSAQRATVLSFDSLMGSAGGVVSQPLLGRVADVFGYGPAYLISGIARAVGIPFVLLARRRQDPCDEMFYEIPEASTQ
jgi:MFS family permease